MRHKRENMKSKLLVQRKTQFELLPGIMVWTPHCGGGGGVEEDQSRDGRWRSGYLHVALVCSTGEVSTSWAAFIPSQLAKFTSWSPHYRKGLGGDTMAAILHPASVQGAAIFLLFQKFSRCCIKLRHVTTYMVGGC